MGRTSPGPDPPPLVSPLTLLLTIYYPRHTTPSSGSPLHHAGDWPLHPTCLKSPRGDEQDSAGTMAIPKGTRPRLHGS